MQTLLQDLRFAARMLRNSPSFAIMAGLTLALAIGANTAIFSAVNGMILRPLPYANSNRLVFLSEDSKARPGMSISPPDLRDWQEQSYAFASMAGYRPDRFTVVGRDSAELVRGANVNANFFATLGVQPVLGRTFAPDEDLPKGPNVVVIGEGLWKARFASAADIVGRTINLDGEQFTIVGVMPGSFHFPAPDSELWTPLGSAVDYSVRGNHPGVAAVARLRDGTTLPQAQAEMTAIARRLERQYPTSNKGTGAAVAPLAQHVVGESVRESLWLLLGAVAFVLLIACVNVANLMFARAAVRQREVAIRASLGASRPRILRLLITESVLISLIGGVLGLLLASWSLDAFLALLPVGTARAGEVHVDERVLLFTLAVSVIAALVFGLAPAIELSRPDLAKALREGGRGGTGGVGRRNLRGILVVAEVGLSLILLIGAGLMLRSFEGVLHTSPGLDPNHVMTFQVSLDGNAYNSQTKFQNFIASVLTRIKAHPGVESASAISPLPVSGENQFTSITIEGHPLPNGQYIQADFAIPGVDYFQTMHIPVLRGRSFEENDLRNSPPVVVIDDMLAREYFASEDPIGKRLCYGITFDQKCARTVVGVVAHVKTYGVDADSRPVIFDLTEELPYGAVTLLVRAEGDSAQLVSAVRRDVATVDPAVPVFNVRPMTQVVESLSASRRLSSTLLAVFSALALVLAAVGIYGVISYGVAQRTNEIGIRMALGARPGAMAGLIVGEGLRLAGAGLLIGCLGGWAVARMLSSELFHVTATDPVTYVGMAALLTAIAGVASYIPARRAMRVDPVVALRNE